MSVYPAPTRYPSIFNPALFSSFSTDTYLSTADANSTYAKLAGGQTIVAEETFTAGIKTATVTTPSNALSITGNVTVSNTSSQAFLSVKSGNNSTLLQTDTSGNGYLDTAQQLYIRPGGTTKCILTTGGLLGVNMSSVSTLINKNAAVYCNGGLYVNNNIECAGGQLTLGTPIIRGSSWTTSAATSHTITSTDLPYLASNGWTGEFKVFVDDQNTTEANNNAGIYSVVLMKPATTLSIQNIYVYKSTNITTFTVTAASNTTLTIAVTPACKMSWLFTGAL